MKREDLKKLGLTDEQIDTVMAENGKDIEATKTTLAAKEQELATKITEVDGYKKQLSERDNDIKALKTQAGISAELNTKLTELQTKYDTDTAGLKKKLDDQALDHATEKYFSKVEFVSELAKKAAMSEFKSKGFKIDNDKFVGADEFIAELKKNDPAAFKPEKQEKPPEQAQQPPFFVAPTGNAAGQKTPDSNPFAFNFAGVRKSENKNK